MQSVVLIRKHPCQAFVRQCKTEYIENVVDVSNAFADVFSMDYTWT